MVSVECKKGYRPRVLETQLLRRSEDPAIRSLNNTAFEIRHKKNKSKLPKLMR